MNLIKRFHASVVCLQMQSAVASFLVVFFRQSYDVDIEVGIAGSGVTSSNTLDLKNPCFRYTGQPVQAPPGTNNTSPTDAYWASVQDGTGNNFGITIHS